MRAFFLILAFTLIHADAYGVYDPKNKSKKESAPSVPTISERLGLGAIAIIQNSSPEWNDEVVKVVEIFRDGSVRILRDNGEKVLVRKKNLERTLSPRSLSGCGDSHGTMICEKQTVFYPSHNTTLGIPEGKVKYVFENKRAIVSDGVDQPFNLSQIGVEVECSVQKPSICRNTYVLGDGYRKGERFDFEGPAEKLYSNGIVVVRSSPFWKFPIDVHSVTERVAAMDQDINNNGAVIMNGGGGESLKRDPATSIKANVTRELEPGDALEADRATNAR